MIQRLLSIARTRRHSASVWHLLKANLELHDVARQWVDDFSEGQRRAWKQPPRHRMHADDTSPVHENRTSPSWRARSRVTDTFGSSALRGVLLGGSSPLCLLGLWCGVSRISLSQAEAH